MSDHFVGGPDTLSESGELIRCSMCTRTDLHSHAMTADSNISTMPPTYWYDDITVDIDTHVFAGTLKDGSRIEHACNGANCRLPEEIIEAECRMRSRQRGQSADGSRT